MSEPAWTRLDDEALLDKRFCDLRLSLASSPLEPSVRRLYGELGRKGIRFRPHFWLSEEWFSPDGVPGIAIPFYLAHPRLMRLERRFMHEVEGGNDKWLMRILRHETGHAIDTRLRAPADASLEGCVRQGVPPLPDPVIRRGPAAGISCFTSDTGTRRAIPPRTSPRRSRSGCRRVRAGAASTPAGRPSRSSSTSTRRCAGSRAQGDPPESRHRRAAVAQ